MLKAHQKNTGTSYTITVALLAVAFIFIPAVLVVSRPFGNLFLCFAVGGSALCVILAWRLWKKWSHLSMPSIANQQGPAK